MSKVFAYKTLEGLKKVLHERNIVDAKRFIYGQGWADDPRSAEMIELARAPEPNEMLDDELNIVPRPLTQDEQDDATERQKIRDFIANADLDNLDLDTAKKIIKWLVKREYRRCKE